MKCPLLTAGFWGDPTAQEAEAVDCLKEECAKWDDKFQQCVDITTAEQLLRIANTLCSILEKMPHVEQFKRA